MKLTFFAPRSELSREQQRQLASLGQVVYIDDYRTYPLADLIRLCSDSSYLAFEPDIIGGFEVAHKRLVQLVDTLPNLKGITLSTRATDYIDQPYFLRRGIQVTNVLSCTTESVAEHALSLILGCAKRIFLLDRRTQKGQYHLEKGIEVAGKTLGIIGLGNIGTRTATLAQGVGMRVVGWDRSQKNVAGVTQQALDQVLANSDFLSLHLAANKDTINFLSADKLEQLKQGTIIINTADRTLVDEQAMAQALQSGQIDSYALEAEDHLHTPLTKCENAFLFQGFGWYTHESLARNKVAWIDSLTQLIQGRPINVVC